MSSDTENTADVKSHNIGQRLSEAAARYPDSVAIAIPPKRPTNRGRADYETMTFRELEADTSRKRRAEVIDQVAAGYILQGALDRLSHLSRNA